MRHSRWNPGIKFLAVSLLVILLVACKSTPKLGVDIPMRIMPMGDSITEGFCDTPDHCIVPENILVPVTFGANGVQACGWSTNPENPGERGYRGFLKDKIAARGLKMEYVGSIKVVDGLAHEGHAGWSTDDLDLCVREGDWLEKGQPNIILLYIGGNDANWDRKPSDIAASLKTLLDDIYKKVPATTEVVVALNMRTRTGTFPLYIDSHNLMNTILDDYNKLIPGVVKSLQDENKHVSLVDMTGAIHSDSEFDELGVHPNPAASERMADVWLAKILEIIGQKP